MTKDEKRFRDINKDCFVPNSFSQINREYANLPEYLRRWCAFKELPFQAEEIFKKLEAMRMTDNVDYISIPMINWDKCKQGFCDGEK